MDSEKLGVLDSIVNMVDKYGMLKLCKALFVMGCFVYIIYNVSDIGGVVEHVWQHQVRINNEHHDAAIEVRRSIKPQVDSYLVNTLSSMDADRSFIMELHNGTNNTAGLPFIYAEMTYEEVRDGIEHIDEDYVSFNLSRFSFPMYLEANHIWYGTIDELYKMDSKLAVRLKSNGVSYMAIIMINGVDNELGYFGFTYCNGRVPSGMVDIVGKLSIISQKLAVLLDSNNVDAHIGEDD
ncbi:MAG: hypothetical protein J6Y37_16590 [Paludibacteraceae bacterium]|nr:hypothetical protein [Paludibacteraceae bacterium]